MPTMHPHTKWRAIARDAGIPRHLSDPPSDSPIGQWLAALSLFIGAPDSTLDVLAGYIIERFEQDRQGPHPKGVGQREDPCVLCPHVRWDHGSHTGCSRCDCRGGTRDQPFGQMQIRRPEAADNPGDALVMMQQMYDRLAPLLDFVGGSVDRDDLLAALGVVAHGGSMVYLASAQDRESGDRVILGVSTTGEGATAYIGAAWLRDRGELINPEVLALELDDPTGKVVKQ